MIRLLWLTLTKSWQEQFPSRTVYAAELISSVLDVLFYYFTSEAIGKLLFGPLQNQTYFEYVVWNEALIAIPIIALVSFTKAVRSSHIDGTWEILLTSPRPLSTILFLLSQADFYRSAMRSILILLIASVLGARFTNEQIFTGTILLVSSCLFFVAAGLFAAALYLIFERGFGAISHSAQLLAVFAGTYFPVSVFPKWMSDLSIELSPWTWLIQGSQTANLKFAAAFLLSGLVFTPVALKSLSFAIERQKKTGRRLLTW